MVKLNATTNIIALLLTTVSFSAVSCMDDKGSYSYTDINEITVDSIGKSEVTIFDTLRLSAKVSQSMFENDDNIDYTWYYYPNTNSSKIDTIGHSKDLAYQIAMTPGDYTFYVMAKDRNSGRWGKRSFDVTVYGQFNNGLLLFGTTDGETSLDWLPFLKNNQKTIYKDSKLLGTNPVMVSQSPVEVLLLCQDDSGGVVLNNGTMLKTKSFKELYSYAPSVIHPETHGTLQRPASNIGDFIINNGQLSIRRDGQELFSPPLSGDYNFSPYVYLYQDNAILFDQKHEKFMGIDYGNMYNITINPLPKPKKGINILNPSDVGMKLLFMGCGRVVNYLQSTTPPLYAIFEDKSGKLLKFHDNTDYSFVNGITMNPSSLSELILPAFAANRGCEIYNYLGSLLFYISGDELYMCDLEEDKAAQPVFSLKDIGVSGEFTALYIKKKLMGDGVWHTVQDIYLAATDKTVANGKNGLVVKLNMTDDYNPHIDKVEKVWHNVAGSIKSILLKE